MSNAQGGIGALLSGFSGGVTAGQNMQKSTAQPGSALGLPGQPQQSATGAVGMQQTQPVAPATSSPDNKAASTANGTWANLASYFSNSQPGQQA